MSAARRNEEDRSPQANTPKGMRIWFGIFMIIVYLGIGLLFILYEPLMLFGNKALTCVVGGLLIAYGVFRGYRLYRGGY